MQLRRALLIALVGAALLSALSWGQNSTSASGGPGIIAVGYDHTCALLDTGGVQCFGANQSTQLGNGSNEMSSSPVDVCAVGGCPVLLSDVQSVSAGREHSCVLTNAGGVRCWGANSLQQLGDGTMQSRSTPVNVVGLSSGVAQLSAGRYFTCVVTDAGGAKCWGSNFYGQLGDGTNGDHGTPVNVIGLSSGVASVETERYHACAVLTSGRVKCWGDNADGQLGHPGVASTNQPVDVCANAACTSLLSDVASVSLGLYSTCALTNSGGVKCWGRNVDGQLGDGTTTARDVPVNVYGLTFGVMAISVGESNACALTDDSITRCWGENSLGQSGNGGTDDSPFPSEVCGNPECAGPLTGVAQISAGAHQACAMLLGGAVKCWGLNITGQLGNGTTDNALTPVDTLLSGVKPAPTPTATLIATATSTRSPTPQPTATPDQVAGDASCDRRVDSIDAALILQYGAGLLTALPCSVGADANGDGQVNALDAALVLQFVAGLLEEL